jgi:hypothetical protein
MSLHLHLSSLSLPASADSNGNAIKTIDAAKIVANIMAAIVVFFDLLETYSRSYYIQVIYNILLL